MSMKRNFVMNGKTFKSMMEIARELGVKRVYPKDFGKYGIEEVTDVDDKPVVDDKPADENLGFDEPTEEATAVEEKEATTDSEDTEEDSSAEVSEEENVEEDKPAEDKPKANKKNKPQTKVLTADELIEEAKNLNLADFAKLAGKSDVDTLVEVAEKLNVKLWETILNQPIRKMRLLMEIKANLFPNEKLPTPTASVWRKFALEDLMKLADENKLTYRKIEHEKVQRMWVIKALNDAGIKPVSEEKVNND